MIKVTFHRNGSCITRVEINGHANSAKRGEDLVCAGVSSIGIGALNAIDEMFPEKCSLKLGEGSIIITVIDFNDVSLQSSLRFLYFQLLTIEQKQKKYIILREVQQNDEI